jgi:integrase
VKALKIDRPRRIAIDPATSLALAVHRGRMEQRAELCELEISDESFIFSDDPDGARPWHPDSMSSFVNRLRTELGITETHLLNGARHHAATELLAAGVDPVTVAGRLGHSPKMTLDTYAAARPAPDQAAADLLGALLESE